MHFNCQLTLSMQQAWAGDKKKIPEMFKNINILEFSDYIWNHYEKCIQISTNMPGIVLEICEISRILRNQTILTNGHVQSIKTECYALIYDLMPWLAHT